jgi:hypothetical protein
MIHHHRPISPELGEGGGQQNPAYGLLSSFLTSLTSLDSEGFRGFIDLRNI